jgi:hypothetical protein
MSCSTDCITPETQVNTLKRINKQVRMYSSSHLDGSSSLHVRTVETSISQDAKSIKGEGVTQKHGSGGSSYVAYLKSRRGCC